MRVWDSSQILYEDSEIKKRENQALSSTRGRQRNRNMEQIT